MDQGISRYDISSKEMARGRKLKAGAIAAPIVLAVVPLVLFLLLSLILSGSPIFAISSFVIGLIATLIGLVVGFIISGVLMYRHGKWTAEMRERIAADGIKADEIEWFKNELKSGERRALKAMRAADPLLEDAFRETLASRLTATRIVRSAKRELQSTKRRELKVRSLNTENAKRFREEIERDAAKIGSIHDEAKQMLAEAEARLQMIEAAASRGGNLADSELALKKLSARSESLPLALEAARIQEETLAEIEAEDQALEGEAKTS